MPFALAVLALLLLAPAGVCADSREFPIALDVGHSAPRWGATSARGVPEYEFNKVLTQRILHALQDIGLTGTFILDSGDSRRSPAERTRLARKRGAVLFLSIHHDSVQPHYLETWTFEGKKRKLCNRFQGYSLFYSERNPDPKQSLELAKSIGANLRLAGFTPTAHHAEPIEGENREFVDPERGVYRFDDLLVLHTASMPSVLFEAGIIVNSIEERALQNPVRQKRMAKAVARGVAQYLGVLPPLPDGPFSTLRLQQ